MNRCRFATWLATSTLGCTLLALSLLAGVPLPNSAGAVQAKGGVPNWTHYRGPSGQGYSDDQRVPLTWSDTENLLWKTELPGRGNSSPIVWGDRVFLTAASSNGDERLVLCVRISDGKLLWQEVASKGVTPGRTHQQNGYASASCSTDGTSVFAFFGTPGLFCYDFEGKLIWKHHFGTFTNSQGWGTAASPVVFEDLVIQNCDNDGARALPSGRKPEEAAPMVLVALEKATGKVRWQTERNQGIGFSTPLLVRSPEDKVELILNGPYGVWAYDPRTGKELWHCERHKGDQQALFGEPLPVFTQDTFFAASGRPGPFQAIRRGGSGDLTKTNLLWDVSRRGHRDVASPIFWDGLLYAADNKGILTCYDPKTGKELYNERLGNAKAMASPVAVRGKLLFLLDDGVTVVVEPGSTFQVAGRNKLKGGPLDFEASPAIVDGKLLLRSQSHLYCIGEKKN
jgi:outer membrane protein assembly factor BamB